MCSPSLPLDNRNNNSQAIERKSAMCSIPARTIPDWGQTETPSLDSAAIMVLKTNDLDELNEIEERFGSALMMETHGEQCTSTSQDHRVADIDSAVSAQPADQMPVVASKSSKPNMTLMERFMDLPGELQMQIVDHVRHLGFPHAQRLKTTCKGFNGIVPKPNKRQIHIDELSPLAMEKRLFACYDCFRLRPSTAFGDAQRTGKRGKNGQNCQKRFCVDCGLNFTSEAVTVPRYRPGSQYKVNGDVYVVCHTCGPIKLRYRLQGVCRQGREETF